MGFWGPKTLFSSHFSYSSTIFSYFLGEAVSYIFPIFLLFRAGGPKPILQQANGVSSLGLEPSD